MENIIQKRKKTKKGFQLQDWPENYLETISCPLCRSKKSRKLYPNSYKRLVICNSCSLIYTNPRLKKRYLRHLYSREYFCNSESVHFGYENYIGDAQKIITTFDKRMREIEKIKKNGMLLDVGCATGFFMKAAQKRGWKVVGNEISQFAAQYAQKHYKFKVYTDDFIKAPIKHRSFDLITMWDVIEHFYDPIQAVKKANSLLNDKGILVLSTPDVDSFPAKIMRSRWVGYKLSDEHLTYFSPKTLSRLLEKAGFKVIKKTHTGKHVSLPMLADRASIYSPLIGSLIKMAEKVSPPNYFLYINPFDIMCIYAEKVSKK